MLSMGIWARSRLHPAMTRTRNRGGNRGKPSSESWPELPKALPCRCSSWVARSSSWRVHRGTTCARSQENKGPTLRRVVERCDLAMQGASHAPTTVGQRKFDRRLCQPLLHAEPTTSPWKVWTRYAVTVARSLTHEPPTECLWHRRSRSSGSACGAASIRARKVILKSRHPELLRYVVARPLSPIARCLPKRSSPTVAVHATLRLPGKDGLESASVE